MNGLDVTTTQYTVLVVAGEKDGLSQQDIINATGIDRSTVSQVVQLLVRKGLVKRRRTRHDARAYAVSLTDAGKRCSEDIRTHRRAHRGRVGGGVAGNAGEGVYR